MLACYASDPLPANSRESTYTHGYKFPVNDILVITLCYIVADYQAKCTKVFLNVIPE